MLAEIARRRSGRARCRGTPSAASPSAAAAARAQVVWDFVIAFCPGYEGNLLLQVCQTRPRPMARA